MGDLPDLDTSQISFIAFWNAIDDGGVNSIDPEDALSDGSIVEYTLYDNGWEGEYNIPNRTITVRVKSDGWIVAYIDRTDNYGTEIGTDTSSVNGHYDILSGWYSSLESNGLANAINSLQGQLDADPFYQDSDVGLYYYPKPATHITRLSSAGTGTFGFLFTDVDIHYAAVLGKAAPGYTNGEGGGDVTFEGTTVAYVPDVGDDYGVLDIEGSIVGETEYQTQVTDDGYGDPWVNVLIVHSPV